MNRLKNKIKSKIKKQAFGVEDLIVGALRPAILSKIPNIIHGQRNFMIDMTFPQWHQKKRLSESIIRSINQNWNKLSPVLKEIIVEAIEIYKSQSSGYESPQRQMSIDPSLQNSGSPYKYNYSFNKFKRDPEHYDKQTDIYYDGEKQMSVQPQKRYHTTPYGKKIEQKQYDPSDVYDDINKQYIDEFNLPYDK